MFVNNSRDFYQGRKVVSFPTQKYCEVVGDSVTTTDSLSDGHYLFQDYTVTHLSEVGVVPSVLPSVDSTSRMSQASQLKEAIDNVPLNSDNNE